MRDKNVLQYLVLLISFSLSYTFSYYGGSPALANDFNGTWDGSYTSSVRPPFAGGLTTLMEQSGNNLSGQISITGTLCTNLSDLLISGNIAENVAAFDLSYFCEPIGGFYDFYFINGALADNNISGNYQVNLNGSFYDMGTFSVNRSINMITASTETGGNISPSGGVSVVAGSDISFTITAFEGYQILDVEIDGISVGEISSYTFDNVNANHTIIASFELEPYVTGDINNDGEVDLYDAILSLQVSTDITFTDTISMLGDVNDDSKIGLEEAIFALRYVSTSNSIPVTVTSAGLVWMDRNLGASRVATSPTDSDAYGDLYQWGRGTDGHENIDSPTTTILSTEDNPGHGSFITVTTDPKDWRSPQNDNLWNGESGINNPCPAGFRLPTEPELQLERASWPSNDSVGALASPLKLTMAGIRNGIGSFGFVNTYGYYWSSTTDNIFARYLFIGAQATLINQTRVNGMSIRCIQDYEPDPISTVVSNGRVWMDRNLGASSVASSSTDPESYGDLYQWGRLTDGHEKRRSQITTTLSSTDIPGHGNFITAPTYPYDWRFQQNDTLWQGSGGINNPCLPGFRLPTEIEFEAERISWGSNNAAGALASPLKLVLAGFRRGATGVIYGPYNGNYYGNYWTSTIDSYITYRSRILHINNDNPAILGNLRSRGCSVRCIQD